MSLGYFVIVITRLTLFHPQQTTSAFISVGPSRGVSWPPMLEMGPTLYLWVTPNDFRQLTKTNQNAGFWPKIFRGAIPDPRGWRGPHPLVPFPVPAHDFWPPIFSTLRRHWFTALVLPSFSKCPTVYHHYCHLSMWSCYTKKPWLRSDSTRKQESMGNAKVFILNIITLLIVNFFILISDQNYFQQLSSEFIFIFLGCKTTAWKVKISQQSGKVGWLVGRSTSPFSTKIGYIRDKFLGGDLVRQINDGQRYSNFPTSLPFCSATTHNENR